MEVVKPIVVTAVMRSSVHLLSIAWEIRARRFRTLPVRTARTVLRDVLLSLRVVSHG